MKFDKVFPLAFDPENTHEKVSNLNYSSFHFQPFEAKKYIINCYKIHYIEHHNPTTL